MNNKKFMKSAKVIERIAKIIQGLSIAMGTLCAITIPIALFVNIDGLNTTEEVDLGYISVVTKESMVQHVDMSTVRMSMVVAFVSVLIVCVLMWYGMRILRRVIAPMKDGQTFNAGVSKEVRTLAWLVLVGGAINEVCTVIANRMSMHAYQLNTLFNMDVVSKYTIQNQFNVDFVIVGLVLFFLAYVFEYGEALQKEWDETL